MGKKWDRSSEELIEEFHKCMEDYPNINYRKMFGCLCCFVNNNMFTGLHEETWIVRLCEEDRKELIEKHGARHFEPMKGRPMREYIVLPDVIRNSFDELQKWVQKSLDFASALPPKIPKRKKQKT